MMQNDQGHITSEEIKEIENLAKRAPDQSLTYATVFKPRILSNPNAETGKYTVVSDTGAAEVVRKGASYGKLKINGSDVTYVIEDLGIEFEILKTDIQTAKSFGRSLNLEYVERTVRAVQEKLNKIAYIGDLKYGGLPGVAEMSGVTAITGGDLTATDANVYNLISTAFDSLPLKYRTNRQYFMVVAESEYRLFQKIGNTYSNETWMNMIEKGIPNLKIIVEPEINGSASLSGGGTIAAGTALFIPYDETLVRMPIAIGVKNFVDKNSVENEYERNVRGRTEARVGPVEAPFAVAIGKVTGLQG